MRTLKFKGQITNAFFATINQMFSLTTTDEQNCAQRFDYRSLGSSRKLGGATEHLIDGSETHICRLSFEF